MNGHDSGPGAAAAVHPKNNPAVVQMIKNYPAAVQRI